MSARVVGAALVASAIAACSTSDWKLAVPPKYLEVAEIHHAHCGSCHTRVEPGERTRAQLEKALARHRTRVRMTESQWALLVDYLSKTP